MSEYTRYAIYYLPEGDLAEFGARWLGWDSLLGTGRPHPALAGLPRPAGELTDAPRRYGFHATLKPPFRLAPRAGAEALEHAVQRFAAAAQPVEAEGLELCALGRFLALTPRGGGGALASLAAQCVTAFDAFRAPPGPEETARRMAAGLNARQAELLERWGYPYVLEEFRFHLTLTGPLEPGEAEAVRAALAPALNPLLPAPFRIKAVGLMGERADGRFVLLSRHPLGGTPAQP